MGLRCRQEGPLSSGFENIQTRGLVPRKCHLVCLSRRLAEEEGEVGGACVFDEVSVVYLKDANAIQI